MSLIIDGYNLIFSAHRRHPAQLSGKEIEASRQHLISRLALYRKNRGGEEITVVFDASRSEWPTRVVQHAHGIRVIYSGRLESADDEIVRLVQASPDPRRLVVVSSDAELRRAVGRLGAKTIRSTTFELQLREILDSEREPQPQEPPEKFEGLSEGEAEAWMKELGFDSDEDR